MGNLKVGSGQLSIQKTNDVQQTKSDGAAFRNTLNAIGSAGSSFSSAFLGGGNIIQAALSGAKSLGANLGGSTSGLTAGGSSVSSSGGTSSIGGGATSNIPQVGGDSSLSSFQSQINQQQKFNVQFLQMQTELQSENRKFATLTNCMKTRHDTGKSAINNIRV